jgi:uncharacterized protein YuzE
VIIKEDVAAGAVYMKLRDGEVAETIEVSDADAYVDLDAEGYVLGIEFLSLDEFHAFMQAADGLRVPERIEEPGAFRLALA